MGMVMRTRHGFLLEGRRCHTELRHDGDDDGAEHDFDHGVAPQLVEHMARRSESYVRHQFGREANLLIAATATITKKRATFAVSSRP